MDVLKAIRSRRTIGTLQGDVPADTIRELVEAATWAPNHKLTEPWRFTVLRGEARAELGKLWAPRAAEAIPADQREKFIEGEARKPLRAPVLIVVSTCVDENPVRAEEDFAATAAAVQNLLLAAHAKGLGAAWKTGKIVHDPEVKRFLGLDPADRIVAMVYLGTEPAEEPQARPRDVEGVIRWLGDSALTVLR
jgi:nitroreductase